LGVGVIDIQSPRIHNGDCLLQVEIWCHFNIENKPTQLFVGQKTLQHRDPCKSQPKSSDRKKHSKNRKVWDVG
jgi:hypothetical protein